MSFNPNQPRDDQGRWTDGSGSIAAPSSNATDAWLASMTREENAAMNAWTSNFGLYKMMNRQELEGRNELVHKDLPTVADLDSALDKAPKVDGTVYRGGQIDERTARSLAPGKRIELKSTKSASRLPEVAERFAEENVGNVVFEIQGRSMPAIEGFSKAIGEAEVVLRRGTKYEVVARERVGGRNKITLRQL